MKKKVAPNGNDKRNQDLPKEILDLIDLLVEIALAQIVASENRKQNPKKKGNNNET